MAEKSGRRSLAEVLAEWRAEVGLATPEEAEWVERALGTRQTS